MNWFDCLLIAIVALYLIGGFIQGFVKQLFSLFGFFIILALAFAGSRLLGDYAAAFIDPQCLLPYREAAARLGADLPVETILKLVAGVLAFLVLFIVLQILFRLIARALTSINRIPVIGFFNRLGGAALGLLAGVVLAYILLVIVSLVPVKFCAEAVGGSAVAALAEQYLPPVTEGLKNMLMKFYLQALEKGA